MNEPAPELSQWDIADRRPKLPRSIRLAGLIWTIAGLVMLGIMVMNVLSALAPADHFFDEAGKKTTTNLPIVLGAAVFGALFGLAFLVCGIQAQTGVPKGMIGNAIGSLIFGCLWVAGGALVWIRLSAAKAAGIQIPDDPSSYQISLGMGVAFLIAGVLGIVGHSAYVSWRAAAEAFDLEHRIPS